MPDVFAHPVERELARVFDEHGVRWEYEPHTFVLERDADGHVTEAFTPDFFLPELGIYVECTVMRQALTSRKRRKVRKVRQRTGAVVAILFRRDFVRLARRWDLIRLASAAEPISGFGASPRGYSMPVGDARGAQREHDFDIGVEHAAGVPVISVSGDVDLYSAPELRDRLAGFADDGARRVVLDLSRVTFLDSMGLGVMLGAKKRIVANGGDLELVVSTHDIRRLLEITMLDRIFTLHDSRASATRRGVDQSASARSSEE
jgi:anti-sigma B factor antagonist